MFSWTDAALSHAFAVGSSVIGAREISETSHGTYPNAKHETSRQGMAPMRTSNMKPTWLKVGIDENNILGAAPNIYIYLGLNIVRGTPRLDNGSQIT
jgi:hypothetical protein